jgi:hypothetical protein
MFYFIPIKATKDAWDNRLFSNQPSIASILEVMKEREPISKFTGYIYFQKGVVSTYYDGSRARKIEPIRLEKEAWERLQNNQTAEGIQACLNSLQTIKPLSNRGQQFIIANEQERLENINTYFPKPSTKNFQEFRHVFDLELQLAEISNLSTIEIIWINHHGYFEWRSN